MKMAIVLAAAVLLVGLVKVVLAEPSGKELASLEQKLLGAWKGQCGCAGSFLFRVDGTYELMGYGPGPYDSAGTWKVRWDALPPTLVLTCKTSEITDEVSTTKELKLIRLDDEGLEVKHAAPDADRYARMKK